MKKNVLLVICLIFMSNFIFGLSRVRVLIAGQYEMLEPVSQESYDEKGRIIRVENFQNKTITLSFYDEKDRLILVTENGNTIEKHNYDEKDRLIYEKKNGKETSYEYDLNGRVVYHRFSQGRWPDLDLIEKMKYDDEGRLVQYSKNGKITNYFYKNDLLDKKQVIDTDGNKSFIYYDYDDKGRLIYVEDLYEADGGSKLYEYDNNGNLTRKWENNKEFICKYDSNNHLIIEKEDVKEKAWRYDDKEQLVWIKLDNLEENYEYDERGNLVMVKDTDGYQKYRYEYNDKNERIREYDHYDNLIIRDTQTPKGQTLKEGESYIYDDGGVLLKYEYKNREDNTYTVIEYDENGNVLHQKVEEGKKSSWPYGLNEWFYEYENNLLVKYSYNLDQEDRENYTSSGVIKYIYEFYEDGTVKTKNTYIKEKEYKKFSGR